MKKIILGFGALAVVLGSVGLSAKFAEAHELMEQGKTTEARKIMNDLGLGLGNGFKQGVGKGHVGRGFNR